MLVRGVAFKKSFSYAGFEQQPKSFTDPKILCLNVELELKAEKDNAEVRVEQVSVCTMRMQLSLGLSSDCRRGMANHLPKVGSDCRYRGQGRAIETPHRRSRNTILRRQGYFL